MTLGARAEIRLAAIRSNLDRLRQPLPRARVLAAVKANAYGHGLVTVAGALDDAVDAFGVARLVEARRLREAGIRSAIVLMGGVLDAGELDAARALDCEFVVHSDYQAGLLEAAPERRFPRLWVKVDTGMRRLGLDPEAVPAVVDRLRRSNAADVLVLMTHLANADVVDDPMSLRQLGRFRSLTEGFDGDIAVANSAALCGWVEHVGTGVDWGHSGETWIRPGVSLYGISPLANRPARDLGLVPAMQFESVLIALKSICAGEPVGYGGTWHAPQDTTLGIIAAGYGDGYPRALPSGTPVLVNGRRVPIAGRISMDLAAVDLGPRADDEIGDRVVLWGEGLPVEEIAGYAQTVAYTLVCGVTDRDGKLA